MTRTHRIAVLGRGITQPSAWSGIPAGLSSGLAELGFTVVTVDADVPDPLGPLIKPWLKVRGVLDPTWEHTPEMAALGTVIAHGRAAWRRAGDTVGWIKLTSDATLGRSKRFVTFEDMTVSQAVATGAFYHHAGASDTITRWRRRQGRAYRAAVGCCVASQWARTAIIDEHGIDPSKVHVVGFGRSLQPRPRPRDWSTPRFLFIGQDWTRKHGALVIDAFTTLRRELPHARLDVVGRHPPLDGAGVTAHGSISLSDTAGRTRLEQLLESATCFVMPSACEPFGIVYVEAAAAGVPSIGTTVGGAADAIGVDGGVLVPPGDPERLLDAMRRLAQPSVAQSMGQAALRRADLFTWRRVAERVVRALGVVAPRGGPLAAFL